MSETIDRPTPRREFLGQIAASAVVLAGTACAAPATAGQTATAPTPAPAPAPTPAAPSSPIRWDDSWFTRLTAKHKAAFDSPEIEDGLAVAQAAGYIRGMRDAISAGNDDVQAVVVIRHTAVPMAFNDAMWAKYELGKHLKVKDYSTNAWATRNPFAAPAPSATRRAAQTSGTTAVDRPQSNLAWLASHGNILLACDLATRGYAGIIANRTKGDSKVIYEELKANLVTGVILQPTGVYAVHRAQEAGCSYIRST